MADIFRRHGPAYRASRRLRRKLSLWTADLLYWAGCGVPLLLIFFALGAHHSGLGWAILIKQPINGLLDVALV